MKKISLLFMAIVAVFSLVGCGNKTDNSKSLGSGKVMALEFVTNPSTGYTWEYETKDGDAKVVYDREEVKLNPNNDLLGAPSNIVYYFKATKAGKTNLVFTYRRPWEGGEVAYDVVYELSVDKNLNITCLSKMKGTVESSEDLSFFPNPTFTDN